jgi:hypothetical protein
VLGTSVTAGSFLFQSSLSANIYQQILFYFCVFGGLAEETGDGDDTSKRRGSIPDKISDFLTSSQPSDLIWASPSLLFNGYWGLLHRGQSGRNVKLTCHFRLVPRFRIRTSLFTVLMWYFVKHRRCDSLSSSQSPVSCTRRASPLLITHLSEILISVRSWKVKVKLSLCLTKHHTMKPYWGTGGIAQRILWRWVDRRLGGPQSRPGYSGGEEKNSQPPPPGIEPFNPDRPARSPALYRLSYHVSSELEWNETIKCN